MNGLIDAQLVRSRMRDFGISAHLQTTALLKGGVFALAALVLIDIMHTPDDQLIRLCLWLLTLASATQAFLRQMYRPLLMGRASAVELLAIVVSGFTELLMLALLIPQENWPGGWKSWFLGFLAWNLAALFIYQTFLYRFKIVDFSESLASLAESHRQAVLKECKNIVAALPLVSTAFAVTVLVPDHWIWLPCLIAVSAGLGLILITVNILRVQRDMDTLEQTITHIIATQSSDIVAAVPADAKP